MDGTDVTDVCRLCPAHGPNRGLLSVFDPRISVKNNMKEVILITTGIEILENDLVSKKICTRCCNITLKMFEFRQDALKQDRELKEKCSNYLGDKGIRLPNTCITIKQEKRELSASINRLKKEEPLEALPSTSKPDLKDMLHPSIRQLYHIYPHLKLPKACVDRHMAPVVSFPMGEVEKYFAKRKLNMKNYIYKARRNTQPKEMCNKVAKKKTGASLKREKTVAPLKISKALFGKSKESINTAESYICTTVVANQKAIRKRSVSSSDTDGRLKSKVFKKNGHNEAQDTSKEVGVNIPITRDDTGETERQTTPVPQATAVQQTIPVALKTPIAEATPVAQTTPVAQKTPVAHTKSVADTIPVAPLTTSSTKACDNSTEPQEIVPFETMDAENSEGSRDSFASNFSVRTTSSDGIEPGYSSHGVKPDFLESFGLLPTVTATKSQTLLVCNLCGSVHSNAFELKRHNMKHMVCQFCKRRFKSIEAKQDHIDMSCEVKEIMNSSGPIVSLERVHLNLEVRKKYKNAFSSFELIPGLQEIAPLEEVIVRAVSPPPPVNPNNIIVLSDDEDGQSTSADPLSGIPTPSANMPAPAIENVVYNTVSIVKPDVRIKKANPIVNNLPSNLSEKDLLKELITFLKPKSLTVEKMLQTDLPANRDIRINKGEGTCEFKNLKEQLLTYKIPISISNGSFHVGYQFKHTSKSNKKAAYWNSLPVVDAKRKPTNQAKSTRAKSVIQKPASPEANRSNVSLTVANALHQATSSTPSTPPPPQHNNIALPTPVPPILLNNFVSNPLPQPPLSIVAVNGSSSTSESPLRQNYAPGMAQSTSVVNCSSTTSATPLLQNYAIGMTQSPVVNSNSNSTSAISLLQSFAGGMAQSASVVNSSNSTSATPLLLNYAMSMAQPTPVVNCSSSTSATPLFQNYAHSKAHSASIANKPLPIPKTFVNSTVNNIGIPTAAHRNYLPRSSLPSSTPNGIARGPPNVTVTSMAVTSIYQQLAPNSIINSNPSPSLPTVSSFQPPANQNITVSHNNSIPQATPSDGSTFRVKNVWELQ